MYEKDRANLLAIIDSSEKIIHFSEDMWDADALHRDEKTFDAVLMNFIVIGESVKRITDDFKSRHPEIPWSKIKDFRNLVAHDYFGVDAEEVWQIIQNDLPDLIDDLQLILNKSS